MRARFVGFLAFFLILSCATALKELSLNDLAPVASIKTAEDAQRALLDIQDFRISAMRIVKKAAVIKNKPEYLTQFESIDSNFRPAWDDAYKATVEWKLTGAESKQEIFKYFYEGLLRSAIKLDAIRSDANVRP